MAEVGDTVRYLNAVGGGRIAKIEGKIAYVDEPDGLTTKKRRQAPTPEKARLPNRALTRQTRLTSSLKLP